jgi:LacI family transcriptional regulator
MDPDKEVTIYDIARELNVSASTVSRALHENKVIKKATCEKVKACAERMGYRSNSFATNLRRKRTYTIGVIIPRLDSNFMSACLAGMEEVASSNGYNLIISQSHESVKKEEENAKTMYNNRVDGLIASLTVEDSDLLYFERFNKKRIPIVFFDRIPDSTKNMCVLVDNCASAYNATKHLIDNGCKELLHLTMHSNSNVYRDREAGFKKACIENNCGWNVTYLDALNIDSGARVALDILKLELKPDGIFVSNDMAAIGCMLELIKNGFSIPEDIAFIGFNNDPVSLLVSPKLSTVTYPGREAGINAAKCLINYLDLEGEKGELEQVLLHTEVVVRESSVRRTKLNILS